MKSSHAGIGGPNIPPPDDGEVAECVANAPGGPIHVLLSDEIAEHIPGCNMAFWKSSLLAIGGFDPQYCVAGDDVDICWRLQQQGWTVGFSPGAVVWHHRRDSMSGYLKQQYEYGKAEALLERKWPERYNRAGHLAWAGRVYGAPPSKLLSGRWKIYYGTWGTGLFQSVYQAAPGILGSLPLMPEWYLVIAGLAGLSALGVLWSPFLFALAAPARRGLRARLQGGGGRHARERLRRPVATRPLPHARAHRAALPAPARRSPRRAIAITASRPGAGDRRRTWGCRCLAHTASGASSGARPTSVCGASRRRCAVSAAWSSPAATTSAGTSTCAAACSAR